MSKYSIDSSTLMAIGDAIRSKTIGTTELSISSIFKLKYQYNSDVMFEEFNLGGAKTKIKINSITNDSGYLYGEGNFVWSQIGIVLKGGYTKPPSDSEVAITISKGITFPYEVIADSGVITFLFMGGNSATALNLDVELTALDENGNEYKYTPLEMADKINELDIMPPQALNISGNCQFKFSYNGWGWLINGYKDKIKCENITDASNMFNGSSNFTFMPIINITAPKLDYTFQNCNKIREITVNWANPSTSQTNAVNSTFSGCYSLRTISGLDGWPAICKGNSIYGLYSTFYNCWCLDELVDIPFIYSTYNGSYQFGSVVQNCYRLKRLVFKLPGADESNTVPLKGATLDLTTTGFGGSKNNLTTYYNSGITVDKEVKDNATYQELKDDPDWFSLDVNYSRYNRNSAIETINSLPDCSATGTNNIKFKGQAGALTDGGAINTLTEEEIAVASAKGWTVSFT